MNDFIYSKNEINAMIDEYIEKDMQEAKMSGVYNDLAKSITIFSNGKVSLTHDKKYAEYAEAVLLPEGHGRLIDANELELALVRHNGAIGFELIGNAPTIVPAEGGTDNDSKL